MRIGRGWALVVIGSLACSGCDDGEAPTEAWQSECSEVHPVDRVGWVQWFEDESDPQLTLRVENAGADEFEGADVWRTDFTMEQRSAEDPWTVTGATFVRCDDVGAWSLGSEVTSEIGADLERTVHDPRLIAPRRVTAGDTWVTPGDYFDTRTLQIEEGSVEYSVGELERVTVPAGTFDALPITGSSLQGDVVWERHNVVVGLGTVVDGDWVLAEQHRADE